MPKEHSLITRLKKLRPVFNAHFARKETVRIVLPPISVAIANIIQDALVVQAGLMHIGESHFDSQQLSDEFAHLVTFAINLPVTIEADSDFWGYALNLVEGSTFKEGAEYCSIERLEDFINVLEDIKTIKLKIRDGGTPAE